MTRQQFADKAFVAIAGSMALIYCVVVLAYVATVPDLRIRVLLTDDFERPNSGILIREVPGIRYRGVGPVAGDVLLRIGNQPIGTFNDFTRSLLEVHRAQVPREGFLNSGDDPSVVREPLPSLVEIETGERLVEIEFIHQGKSERSWVFVQSLPLNEILPTLIWFVLQIGITAVGALSVWNRPFDRSARLFFAMCVVTLGAFVGGFHWWVIACSLALNVPFVGCAVFVPVVSLHFFLNYPRRTWPLTHFPRTTLVSLYTVPTVAFLWIVGILVYAEWITYATAQPTGTIAELLRMLRDGIYLYLMFATFCFLAMLTALAQGYLRTTNAAERNQLKWIFWGGVSAVLPVGYTLYLAFFDRVEFALGRARLAMFLASLSFMLAYAVAILRFKLMLIDQIVSKGMRYYSASVSLTAAFAGLISLGGLTASIWGAGGPSFVARQQVLLLGAVLAVAVTVLLWGRDRLQQLIDLRFYREKYQLDKALQRINRAVESVADRETLARRMIGSCRDVLRADRIAVYLRDLGHSSFQLIAVEGASDMPAQIVADEELMQTLQTDSAIARSVNPLIAPSSSQQTLRALRVDLLYAFNSDGEVAGAVALGAKQNATPYTAEDLTFLNALGQITSVALHSVKVHQDLFRLNEEMQRKAEKIEEQRRVISMLQQELRTAASGDRIEAEVTAEDFNRGHIKGSSPAIQRVLETVRKVSQSESSVLITGPSGTGKELLAQAIHSNSGRRNGPMINVHCAALSPSLLESELFGHVKGAFTGAHKDRIGRFEAAHGGTLFLDEIGDISLETQVKLLRVLQTRQFEPVGSARTVHIDVRLITATNQDLKKLIGEGKFREDLFYRLNVISILLPTLTERREDIHELALHFLKRTSQSLAKSISEIDDAALEVLKRYSWPGNIRELQNVIERAVVLAEGDSVRVQDLPREIIDSPRFVSEGSLLPPRTASASVGRRGRDQESMPAHAEAFSRGRADEFIERDAIEHALRTARGNKAEAARLLGIPRSTFFSKLRKYRINKPR